METKVMSEAPHESEICEPIDLDERLLERISGGAYPHTDPDG